jgi:hypothetical protein
MSDDAHFAVLANRGEPRDRTFEAVESVCRAILRDLERLVVVARLLNAAGNERLRANDCNCDRSSSFNTNSAFGLPVLIAVSPFQRYRIGTQD